MDPGAGVHGDVHTGVAVFGALYASRVTAATLSALAGLPAPPGAAGRLAAAVTSGAGTRAAAAVPPAARAAVTHAARAGTASGLNDVLLAAAAFAALGAIAGFAYGPDPAKQPMSGSRPRRTVRPVAPRPAPGLETGQARNNGTITLRTPGAHPVNASGGPLVSTRTARGCCRTFRGRRPRRRSV
jgi:hypothetical protein